MALTDYVVTPDAERAVGQGILQESESKNCELGTELVLNDGRKFRYCLNGAGAVNGGVVCESPAWATDHESLATNTAPLGAYQVTVTNGASTALTADMYTDGFLCVETVGGAEAGIYKIKSHPAALANATCVITLYDPLRVVFAASTTATLMKNRYSDTIITVASGSTETGVEVGVPIIPVTAAYFYWAQFKGPCNVLIDGTPAIGTPLMRGSVAGSLALADSSFKEVATMAHTGVTAEMRPVILDIP